ncbi:Hypothetical predicted protein [Xyrichtys novacula]|uniref:Uncharacterized protein n=1 Tax=Xyrichtys novacula TaxID=13765 RepID=A0AAV1H7U0_XYRNO|nr:Hypothetical predicted protein [Xyrichtys novacula]
MIRLQMCAYKKSPNSDVISVCACSFTYNSIFDSFEECLRHHTEITALVVEMQYTQMPQTRLLIFIQSSGSAEEEEEEKRRRRCAWLQRAAVQRGEHRASGMGRKDAAREKREREIETDVISRPLPPASLFKASVLQQLSEERQIKVRGDRQAEETCRHRRAPVLSTYF